jgi:lipoyl(octanoyl) transferase
LRHETLAVRKDIARPCAPPAGGRTGCDLRHETLAVRKDIARDIARIYGMDISLRHLGLTDYLPVWDAMRDFTQRRAPGTPDEIWFTEHRPVFTLGQSGKSAHILRDMGIPVIKTDRGGQVTYHGPGQLVVYLLLDLRRRRLRVGDMVRQIEAAVIDMLGAAGLVAARRPGAPGVYMGTDGQGAKIAALGLRVTHGASYHGMSLNVDMDLAPFTAIDPCGYAGLAVTQTRDEGLDLTVETAGEALYPYLQSHLSAAPRPGGNIPWGGVSNRHQ